MRVDVKAVLTIAVWTGGVLFLIGCSEPVPAPTAFDTYNCKAGTFQCDCPEGWTVEAGGKKQPWAKFTRGPATIHIGTSITGSLMAGPGLAVEPPDLDDSLTAVAQVHEAEKQAFAEEWSDFEEQTPISVPTKRMGKARKAEFTAAATLAGKVHGYRATILAHDHRVRVVCTCPESDWATLQPAFDRVIESLERGYVEH